MEVNGVKVTGALPDMTATELARYIDYVKARILAGDTLDEIIIRASGEGVDVSYRAHGEPFERIRRITG